MGLVVAATFALCLWIVLTSLGWRSLDGFLLALTIIVAAAGTRIMVRKLADDE